MREQVLIVVDSIQANKCKSEAYAYVPSQASLSDRILMLCTKLN